MPKIGLNDLLRPEDSILVLIDHQAYQFTNLNSHDPQAIVNNVTSATKRTIPADAKTDGKVLADRSLFRLLNRTDLAFWMNWKPSRDINAPARKILRNL